MADDQSTEIDDTEDQDGQQNPEAGGNGTGDSLLAGYPGAALLVKQDGTVVAANHKGTSLSTLIDRGSIPDISDLISKSAIVGTFAVGTVNLAGSKGSIILEITVIPQAEDQLFMILTRDMTMERNLRTALVESRQRYKDLVEVSSDFSWEVGEEGIFVFVSPNGALGFTADELTGKRPEEYVLNAEEYSPLPFNSDRPLENIELWMRKSDGSTACVYASCLPLYADNDEWRGTRGVCRDITEERGHEAALARARNREQLLNYIVSAIRDELEPGDMLVTAAAATARALGTVGCGIYRQTQPGVFENAANFGDPADGLETIKERAQVEDETFETEIADHRFLVTATRYRQTVNGFICMWKSLDQEWSDDDHILIGDVANQLGIANEQIANHERIVKLSRTDGMTGLLNRRAFLEEELPRRLARMEFTKVGAALYYVDMDNFKRVNDVHGHQAGDDAIMRLRELLVDHSRPGDVIARLGGDEFAMWLDGMPPDVAKDRAETLIADSTVLREFSGDEENPLGISVGVAMFDPDSGETLDNLLARADEAMYIVKNAGKGGYYIAPASGAEKPAGE